MKTNFNRNLGIGSSSQDLLEEDKINLETSVSEAGLNTVDGWCTTGKSMLQLEAEFRWSYLWKVWKKNPRVN